MSAPRERGSASISGLKARRSLVCPARAGIGPPRRSPRSRPCRLPRASGDRPYAQVRLERQEQSAPRERGSALHPVLEEGEGPVCPARAGIGRDPAPAATAGRRLPRASGDRPSSARCEPTSPSSAPRERGSADDRGLRRGGAVCPARAGIGRGGRPAPRSPRRLPRASGDRPRTGDPHHLDSPSAPRERGSAGLASLPGRPGRVCPARAGIGPHIARPAGMLERLPRASGDRPPFGITKRGTCRSAPRERGSARAPDLPPVRLRVCPARAGIGPCRPPTSQPSWRLPRASGDRPAGRGRWITSRRSAPRERGSAPSRLQAAGDDEVCPARAGIGRGRPSGSRPKTRLPRASGDRPFQTTGRAIDSASAPRERGSAARERAQRRADAVCPARAGIGPSTCSTRGRGSGLPRASGDRPWTGSRGGSRKRSAPRERGSAGPARARRERGPVCPARAGIGRSRRPRTRCSTGLPRASGDRPDCQARTISASVSAPRERGSAQSAVATNLSVGVCPARAGIGPSTMRRSRASARLPRASGDRP